MPLKKLYEMNLVMPTCHSVTPNPLRRHGFTSPRRMPRRFTLDGGRFLCHAQASKAAVAEKRHDRKKTRDARAKAKGNRARRRELCHAGFAANPHLHIIVHKHSSPTIGRLCSERRRKQQQTSKSTRHPSRQSAHVDATTGNGDWSTGEAGGAGGGSLGKAAREHR